MQFLKFSEHFLLVEVIKIAFLGHDLGRNAIIEKYLNFKLAWIFLTDKTPIKTPIFS